MIADKAKKAKYKYFIALYPKLYFIYVRKHNKKITFIKNFEIKIKKNI